MGWKQNGGNRDEQLESNNFLRRFAATETARLIPDLLPSICFPRTSWCGPAYLLWHCSLLHFQTSCLSNTYASFWVQKELSSSTGTASMFENCPPSPCVLFCLTMPCQTGLIKFPWTSQISRESKFVYFLKQSNITQSIEWQLKTTSGSFSIILHP